MEEKVRKVSHKAKDTKPEPEIVKELEVSEQEILEQEEAEEIPGLNPLLRHIVTGNVPRLQKIFEDPKEPLHLDAMKLLMKEDVLGRNLLYTACMAGQSEVIKALAKYGVNLNAKTSRGYTLLHCAAAWGRLETLKALVELEVDIDVVNFHNETARDVAIRYSQTECVGYLDFAVARLSLKRSITKIQTIIVDPEKAPGKMSKEDKILLTNVCRIKTEWIELHPDATIEEVMEQKQQLENVVNPVLLKMASAQITSRRFSEKPGKTYRN
ncbi:ankyrin repeat domain-containing protein 45 isoform X1 [Sarcophilus harrisii]|uniref:Ankyrin repeat domain 45 n=1 Tax=Sarcophilus harrisii TaxID=9305 RepID=A0A7N4NH92_SARHA|nr:ankyrin repeat domain-containing protein 45 isoform X1 [Sarcophilus harrisii]